MKFPPENDHLLSGWISLSRQASAAPGRELMVRQLVLAQEISQNLPPDPTGSNLGRDFDRPSSGWVVLSKFPAVYFNCRNHSSNKALPIA
jgi:hypothetical protein